MDQRTNVAIDTVMPAVADKTTWGGAVMGFVGWLASINWIGLTGLLVAALGLLANIYFQHRRDKREQRESEARLASLEGRAPHRQGDISPALEKVNDAANP